LSSGLSLALVLAVLTLVTSAMGLSAASAGREALAQKEVELARRLAEAGAAEAFVVLARTTVSVSAPSSWGVVCMSSSPCSSASPDYLGCYTYRGLTPYPAGASCTAPGPFTGVGLVDPYTVWALGVTRAGTGFQVAVTVSGRRSVAGWAERLR
jgi:hypothetical protein